jgi:hypothetical protein
LGELEAVWAVGIIMQRRGNVGIMCIEIKRM